jgi:hypothetical protein
MPTINTAINMVTGMAMATDRILIKNTNESI